MRTDRTDPPARLNPLAFGRPEIRVLHFTWIAFFISFYVWFNHAPLLKSIQQSLGLSAQELKTLLILNVAMTIPARIVIGMLVDKFGPRQVYSALLMTGGAISIAFAFSQDFVQAAILRFLLGFIGAGFVIGIRMISEWFPARTVGLAEGIYGGWGNFGSAAAAITLPTIALLFGGADGWRWAVASSGGVAMLYGAFYFFAVSNTPKGSTYFRPKKTGALEVSCRRDFWLLLIMKAPLVLALGLLAWKLGPANLDVLPGWLEWTIHALLVALYGWQAWHIWEINKHVFKEEVPQLDRYDFRQVAALDIAYFATFGSELAVVSMLPLFFADTFGLSPVSAGLLASGYAFMNLVARPTGGLLSDRFGRRGTMMILLAGLSLGYLGMSSIDSGTWLPLAVALTMLCSFFVQSGEGAVFAMVPLIKRRLTGQIAGQVGAYGNVGAVMFLTVLSFVSPQVFFLVIGAAGLLALLVTWLWLKEPQGHMAEVLPDGTVELIKVE
ncbi:MAG TPA: NarK family nitrate/nitrite MFS transporter [Thermopetrobacter sp.]|nr:NarK family nitrate/nitrite MFS transporter [Thermopetrobacter sp.]